VERSDRLRAVIAATPELQGYAEKPFDEHGVNFEGLAVRSERLFLGFGGPVLNGKGRRRRSLADVLARPRLIPQRVTRCFLPFRTVISLADSL
jgi:hypothetical protein